MNGLTDHDPAIVRNVDRKDDLTLTVQAVVIGTGAGGSIALRELARAGIDAIALEEGGDHVWRDFDQREDHMLPVLFQERGGRATDDFAITVLQGRGVGGSTIHNTNLCKRTPDAILERWNLPGFSPRDLAPSYEAIERDLSVSRIPDDAVNGNNDVLRRGVDALGWRGGVLSHNRVGCVRSGFCELGCAYDAKQNARKIVIPEAIAHGARVLCDVRATKVLHDDARVLGVVGKTPGGAVVRVNAQVVVLAGSAVGSAALALASDLPDPHDQIGRHLHLHPGGAVAGVFDAPIEGWHGIPQSYECTEWLDFSDGSNRRVWITTAFAHPIGTAVGTPGFGPAHMAKMRRYSNLAVLTAMVHDETEGRVTLDGERPKLSYKTSIDDREQLVLGLRACARILLAAGAREVMVPSIPPLRITRDAEIEEAITRELTAPHVLPLTSVHPMGTMRLGVDRFSSVVDPTGRHHHLEGLYVADGSLFPSSIGGPPQISIYAFAHRLAPHMIEAARRG